MVASQKRRIGDGMELVLVRTRPQPERDNLLLYSRSIIPGIVDDVARCREKIKEFRCVFVIFLRLKASG